MPTIFTTNVGSHMWNMNRPDSDTDLFKIYLASSYDILIGKRHDGGHESKDEMTNTETASFELGHHIRQLKSGNVNHVWGLMSPIVIESSETHDRLKGIFMSQLSKNAYHSIHGLAVHNFKRYFEDTPRTVLDDKEYNKKLGQVGRTLVFGINLMQGKIEFNPIRPESRYDIQKMMDDLDSAYKSSTLPDKPHDTEYDDFLYQVRLNDIKEFCL